MRMEANFWLLAVFWFDFSLIKAQTDFCASAPCQNGGICYNLPTTYSCGCATGFGGIDCSTTGLDSCSSYQCLNGGTCSTSNGLALCICVLGWTDPICGTDYNDCTNTPCLNNGTCVDGLNMFTCTCQSGYSGSYCEIAPDPCARSPCLNGGTCTASGTSFTCACPSGLSGNICQTGTVVSPCDSNPCFNGGTCVNAGASYTCTCSSSSPYTGPSCDIVLQCPTGLTLTNGMCSAVLTSGFSDFTGANAWCSALGSNLPLLKSATDTAAYSAAMNLLGVTNAWLGLIYSTTSKTFFWADGTTLGIPTNWNSGSPGTLGTTELCVSTSSSNSYKWSVTAPCNSNFTAVCLSPPAINYCGSQPCKNGGTCFTSTTGYTCVCPAGVIGSNCEQPNYGMSWVYQTCDLKLQCDPMSSSTCGLGDYCICKTGTSYDFTNNVCVPVGTAIATLTPNCVTDNDCNGTFSANCINSECTCPNGMLAANNICPPAPLFNINGGCINTTLVWFPNENICRIPRLNEACPTGLCATSAMTCSSNGICTAPAMNENCNGICADPAATCLNGVCSCQQYFVYDSATKQCVETPMNAGMPCSPVQHLCNNTILTSGGVTSTITVTCDLTSMMCTCPVGFTVVKNQCATASACPGDSCAHNETCTNKAKCLNGICQCPLGLGWNPGVFGACGSCQTVTCPQTYLPIVNTTAPASKALGEFKINCSIDLQLVGKYSSTCDYSGTWKNFVNLCVPNNVEDFVSYSQTTLPQYSNDPDTYTYLLNTFLGKTDANNRNCLNLYLGSDPAFLVQASMNVLANSPAAKNLTAMTETQVLNFMNTMLDFFDYALTGENGKTLREDPVSSARFIQAIDAFSQIMLTQLSKIYGNNGGCGNLLEEFNGKSFTWNNIFSKVATAYSYTVQRNRTAGTIHGDTVSSLGSFYGTHSVAGAVFDIDLNPVASTATAPWGKHFEIVPQLVTETTYYQRDGKNDPVIAILTFLTPKPLTAKEVNCVSIKPIITTAADMFSTDSCVVSGISGTTVRCQCNQAGTFGLIILVDDPTIVTLYSDDYIQPIQTLGLIISCVCLLVAIGFLFYIRKLVSARIFILRNVCCTLCLAQFILLLSRAISDQEGPCRAFAIMAQYFFNAFSTWMIIFGVSIIVMLATGYKVSILICERNHKLVLCLVGYGIPMIILGITTGVSFNEFGTPGFCFLSLVHWLPLSFIVPLQTTAAFNAPVCLGSLIYYMAKRKMINPKLLYWAAVRGNGKLLAAVVPLMLCWGISAICQFSTPLDKSSAYCNVVFGFLTGIVLMIAVIWLNNEVKEAVIRQKYKKPIHSPEDMEQLLEHDQYHY